MCKALLRAFVLSGGLLWAFTVLGEEPARVPFRHVVIDCQPPARPHCKTAGDLNGDGSPDVLVASSAGQGLWWYAWPDWSKHRIDTGSFSTDMQVGDVDRDGDLDAIIPRRNEGIFWYENPRPKGKADSAAWKRHQIASCPGHDVEVGDVNGDGKLDVVTRLGRTYVLLQKGPDEWTRIEIATGGRGGMALADLDGDGDLDVVQNGYWLEAPAEMVNGEWKRHEIASGWPEDCGVHVVDLNGDGRLNVLLAPAETTGRLSWYEAADAKQGPWREHVIDPEVAYIHTFKTGDADGDGRLDVITAEMEQSAKGRIAVHFNLGDGLKWQHEVVGYQGSHNLRVADIGDDGDLDILGTNHGNHGGATPLDLWENLRAEPAPPLTLDQWERHEIDPERPGRAVFIAPGDLDDDGKPDVVAGAYWYRNPGRPGGDWKRRTIGEPFNNFALAYDFDGDGDTDLLGSEWQAGRGPSGLVWAENDGKGTFTIHGNIPRPDGDFPQGVAALRWRLGDRIRVALSWHGGGKGVQMLTVPEAPTSGTWGLSKISEVSQDEALSVADLGRDVKQDLVLGTRWLRNDGSTWSLHVLNPTPGDPDRNRLADVNGDGRLDAVVGFEAINKPGKLAWYEQPAAPTDVWTEHVIATVVGPMSVDVADLDRDGDVDVVVGEHNYQDPKTAKLFVFENLEGRGIQWKPHVISVGDEHHDGAQLVDIDGDGDLDVLSIGWGHNKVLLYENRAISAPAGK